MNSFRVFFNEDCMMYGVQELVNYGYEVPERSKKWTQVLPPKKSYGARHGKSAYTAYKKVAERWKLELERVK